MTDKEYYKQKSRVQKSLNKWQAAGFAWFKITHTFKREAKDSNEMTAAADCTAYWEYKSAWVNWYLPNLVGKTDDELEGIVVHELSHILISSTQNYSTDQDRQMTEFAASMVADALIWASQIKT